MFAPVEEAVELARERAEAAAAGLPVSRWRRVLVTGGAGTIGTAVVRRLLADGRFDVRVSDQREAPDWMRRECEVVDGDLRDFDAAGKRSRVASAPSTWPRSSAASPTSTSCRTRCSR